MVVGNETTQLFTRPRMSVSHTYGGVSLYRKFFKYDTQKEFSW